MDIEEEERGLSPTVSPAVGRMLDVRQVVVEPPNCWSRTKQATKTVYAVTASHVGLAVIMAVYSFGGAFVFSKIEAPHENHKRLAVTVAREHIVESAENVSSALWGVNDTAFWEMLGDKLEIYEAAVRESYNEGVSISTDEVVWDYWGAMFFCVTTYTTIGYGNFAPVTKTGRVATIIYALIGIPLCLVVMADFGRLFTRILKFFWAFVRRFYYTGSCRKIVGTIRRRSEGETETDGEPFVIDDEFNLPPVIAVVIAAVYIMLGAAVFIQWEEWTYLESFYFIFISISTIGFGDVLPDHPKRFMASFIYLLFGLSLVAMLINVIMEVVTNTIDTAKTRVLKVGKTIGLNLDVADSDSEGEAEEPGKKAD